MRPLRHIKAKIVEQGRTQLEIAQGIGMNPSSLSMALNGWTPFPEEKKRPLAKALGESMDTLFLNE